MPTYPLKVVVHGNHLVGCVDVDNGDRQEMSHNFSMTISAGSMPCCVAKLQAAESKLVCPPNCLDSDQDNYYGSLRVYASWKQINHGKNGFW
jgi:hypothetical protein